MIPNVGISEIGVAIPEHFIPVTEIAKARGISPGYAIKGLGVLEARIPYDTSLEDLVVEALSQIDLTGVERIYLATESDPDMSKPMALKAINRRLGITIVPVQSKFACLAGLQALILACEYSVAHGGKPAVVIAVDRSIYSESQPEAEITEGCAAVAIRVEMNPKLLALDYLRYGQYAEDIDDFKIPLSSAPFPEVYGDLTKPAFLKCLKWALKDWKTKNPEFGSIIERLDYLIVHVPFKKMVIWYMAMFWRHEKYGQKERLTIEECAENPELWDEYKKIIDQTRGMSEFDDFLKEKVEPGLEYNPQIGNPYTVAIFISLIAVLEQIKEGQEIGMCGYGSGAGAIIIWGKATSSGFKSTLGEQIKQKRKDLTLEQYQEWRERTLREIRPTPKL